MNLDKAIKILEDLIFGRAIDDPNDHRDALQLGIEALQFFQEFQKITGSHQDARLPGETEHYCKFCGIAHTGIECPSREGEK